MVSGDGLFVYGTLEFSEVVLQLLGQMVESTDAQLFGYQRFCLKRYPFPGIIAFPKAKVDGKLLTGITPKHLRLLDRYEGDMYDRKRVKVVLSDKHIRSAWVYVVSRKHRRELSSQAWNKHEFAARHLDKYLRDL